MPYQLQLTNIAERDLLALSEKLRQRIDVQLLALAVEPRPDGVVKLKGTKGDLWRIRGSFRVLFSVDDRRKIVEIARVLDRKEAYRTI